MRYQLLIALLALFGVVALAQATQEQAVLRDKLEADISMVKYFTYRPLNNNCMACTLIATMIGTTPHHVLLLSFGWFDELSKA